MKKYVDIENARLEDITLEDGSIRKKNCNSYEIGDRVVVQEKVDGSCASFQYLLNGKFKCWSRRQELSEENNLNGFYQYCEKLAERIFAIESKLKSNLELANDLATWDDPGRFEDLFDYDKMIIFGEWLGKRNKVEYDQKWHGKWIVFDVFDSIESRFIDQAIVKLVCDELELDCVKTLAYIEYFLGWDTIIPFANASRSLYGKCQEGIIVKNMSKLTKIDFRDPVYLKFVNKEFRESKIKKVEDPEKLEKLKIAENMLDKVVTKNRIDKVIRKLVEDGTLEEKLNIEDLSRVAKVLPRAVFEDLVKEEKEVMEATKDVAGKIVNKKVMAFVKRRLI